MEDISKQTVEGAASFLPVAQSKMQKERGEPKREMLSTKEAAPEDSGGSRCAQIAKDAKLGESVVGKAHPGEKPRVWLGNLLLKGSVL